MSVQWGEMKRPYVDQAASKARHREQQSLGWRWWYWILDAALWGSFLAFCWYAARLD